MAWCVRAIPRLPVLGFRSPGKPIFCHVAGEAPLVSATLVRPTDHRKTRQSSGLTGLVQWPTVGRSEDTDAVRRVPKDSPTSSGLRKSRGGRGQVPDLPSARPWSPNGPSRRGGRVVRNPLLRGRIAVRPLCLVGSLLGRGSDPASRWWAERQPEGWADR